MGDVFPRYKAKEVRTMTYHILYGNTEKIAVLAQYKAAEDTQNPGADVSFTTPDGEETVSEGAGEMESGEAELHIRKSARHPLRRRQARRRETRMKMEMRSRSCPRSLLRNLPKPTSPLSRTEGIRRIRSLCRKRSDSPKKRKRRDRKIGFYFQKPRWWCLPRHHPAPVLCCPLPSAYW